MVAVSAWYDNITWQVVRHCPHVGSFPRQTAPVYTSWCVSDCSCRTNLTVASATLCRSVSAANFIILNRHVLPRCCFVIEKWLLTCVPLYRAVADIVSTVHVYVYSQVNSRMHTDVDQTWWAWAVDNPLKWLNFGVDPILTVEPGSLPLSLTLWSRAFYDIF